MRNEVLRDVTFEQDNLGLGIILESLDNVRETAKSILTPDVHF